MTTNNREQQRITKELINYQVNVIILIINLGGGIGNSFGSFLIGVYGQRVTFRIFAVIAFITGLFYFLFSIFYLRPIAVAKMNNAKADLNVNDKIEKV